MSIVLDELVSILTDFETFFMRSAFAFYLLRNVLFTNNASCPGGDPYESDGDARLLT